MTKLKHGLYERVHVEKKCMTKWRVIEFGVTNLCVKNRVCQSCVRPRVVCDKEARVKDGVCVAKSCV